ncbi:MAG: acyl-CoA thioesterase, partial [Sulfitobacter sp.]|nr:acyl-CoA thioesterase [Sulfitobacter sp.]
YPRFFEMMNDTVEAFFAKVLSFPFAEMHLNSGIPTAQIAAEFQAPSRLGDILDITLSCTRLGRSSLDFAYDARCGGAARFTATSTVVFIDEEGRSQPWTERIRSILTKEIEGVAHGT